MFGRFHQRRLMSEKSQIAPLMILVLVLLIIMAMVTVNIYKVAMDKTYSANSADAGALAGGSVMANVFNAAASANADMEFAYWDFYTAIMAEYVLTFGLLIAAEGGCYAEPRVALGNLGMAITGIKSMMVTMNAAWIAQNYFYRAIRKMAKEGRESAIQTAHKFNFMNSGVGSRLKDSADINEVGARAHFSKFLDDIGHSSSYAYAWTDGQGRAHTYTSQVALDEIDEFDVKVAFLPHAADLAFMVAAFALATAAVPELTVANNCSVVFYICIACCSPGPGASCCACAAEALACWEAACAAATPMLMGATGTLTRAALGLLPSYTVSSDNDDDMIPFIPCWIEEIEPDRDRRISVDSLMSNEGADLGLWQMQYPDVRSYSVADFSGSGDIHPPNLRYDASIIETDI